ncbi:hypothetical protein DL93DRAFT_543006 [Clavulina sp. PMI_390]|nr:hypothetical protein DL93DRAFT_543006 [Clavulina sp. PMI_390]
MALGNNTYLWESTPASGNQHMALGINTSLWEPTHNLRRTNIHTSIAPHHNHDTPAHKTNTHETLFL